MGSDGSGERKFKVVLKFWVLEKGKGRKKHYSIEFESTMWLTREEWLRIRDAVVHAFEETHPHEAVMNK